MSAGDIARKLGITVEATDKASGKLSNVKREVAGIQGAAGVGGSGFSRFVGGIERGASRMKSAIGGAASHFKSQMAGIASAGIGILGVGGLFGIGAVISKSISEASAFGTTVANVSRITGLAVPVASSLVDTLDKWGLSGDKLTTTLGRLTKNVFGLTDGSKAAKKFHDEFGVSLVNSKGKALDANAVLLKSADYFNSNASASQKAAFLQKLYGKSWTDLIPILSKGSAAIKDEEKNSIKLSEEQLANIAKYKIAARDFHDVLGDIEVKIGANIMPRITSALQAVGGWMDSHGDDIATFFGNAADAAGNIAGAAIDVFGGLKAGWDSIPAPLRDLLVKGLVADRTMKFLFGFSPAALTVKLGTELLGGVAGAVGKSVAGGLLGAGIGKAFVQPVFVTNMGPGGVGGAGGAAAGGGKGLKGALGTAASAFVLVEALNWVQDNVNLPKAQSQAGANIQGTEGAIATGDPRKIAAALDGVKASVASLSGLQKIMYDLNANGVKTHTEGLEAALAAALAESGRANLQQLPEGISRKEEKHFNSLRDKIESSRIATVAKQSMTISATDRARAAVESARIAQVAATRTGDSAIVAAIHGIRFSPTINLTVPVTAGKTYIRRVTSSSGTTLIHVGGNAARGAEAGLSG